ncbi:class II aldolase/adducin family protein [Sulfobacillus harzensis]|uniref:Class II aldolase/adducin family protein n=1 Tax=Sulfobacillus harzensis TaxID=2729629 RepID=A0A7Y0Q4B6_9FIRM|nr:class II aldolase/adducin family protein [Sulfobacillus harzensis]NMP24452.1 class II aldolase/adducin family protein [Sulfobacillus harzensis]
MQEQLVRQSIVNAAHLLAESGMLFRGEHANLSARLDDTHIVMTRGGSIANLGVDDLAVLDLNGHLTQGEAMDPTMQEVVQMHTRVYQNRGTVGAVIHTHAPHVSVFAVAHQPIPLVYEPLLRFGVTEPIPVVPWAPRGSEKSVGAIVDVVQNHPGLPAVMMANHGALVFHEDPMSAARLLATLDEAAQLIIQAKALGGAKELPREAIDAVRERMAEFGSRR